MKQDESFNPALKSAPPSPELKFRQAIAKDREAIIALMSERNPDKSRQSIEDQTDREIDLTATNPLYWLFVAEINNQVVGFCRHYHSSRRQPKEGDYPGPEGWYCAGLMTDSARRRLGIARFLSENRIKSMKDQGVIEVFSVVDSQNLTSIKMHEEFGFKEIKRAKGFRHFHFETEGILFRREI